MRNTTQGFTLIELVVVIVILGILAAVAVPKFINIQSDARVAVVQGVSAAVRSASDLVHAKALAQGLTAATGTLPANSVEGFAGTIAVAYGYPTNATIATVVNIPGGNKITVVPGVAGGAAAQFNVTPVTTQTTCRVTYTQPIAANTVPAIFTALTNCN